MTKHTPNPTNIITFDQSREPKKIFTVQTKPHRNGCQHERLTIDEATNTIQCGLCDEVLSPIWALKQLADKHNRLYYEYTFLIKEAGKAKQMNRCKCQKCGEMTKIVK